MDPPGIDDCIGETWLEASGGGVAHYGATDTTGTSFNHQLDELMFKTVYDAGLITHGMAIDSAELVMWIAGWQGKNTRRYLLLGDPSMQIRREPTAPPAVPRGLRVRRRTSSSACRRGGQSADA